MAIGRLGEMLLKAGLISKDQLDEALDYQKTHGGKLGYNLVKLSLVKEEDITSILSEQYGVPAIHLEHFEIDPEVIKLVNAEMAQKYMSIPIERTGAVITVAMADPANVFAIDDIKAITGRQIEPVVASEASIRAAIEKYYGSQSEIELKEVMEGLADEDQELDVIDDEEDIDVAELAEASQDAPVIKLVNLILSKSVKDGASDIHIEPYEKSFRIRYRIDGTLYEEMHPPLKLKNAVASRVKILSKLDIAEKRLPQDGRIKLKMKLEGKTKEIDYRVSTVPTLHGEKIVLRLLDKEGLKLDLTKLGFEPASLTKFETAINKPYGMCLVTGPTGSGKTNTLYSAIGQLNTPETNIMTAEDPVEFNLSGINQVQMKEQIGLTFASALRAFLRQDPNIILVGEIRDFETAEIAVKAALTGHLVLSTLHTNDAPSTINRLLNMGIEPFLVATSVHLIQAQRLVRRVCNECKEEVKVSPEALINLGFTEEEAPDVRPFKGRGCPKCKNTGNKGRIGLMEVMEITESLRELILTGANSIELKREAIAGGMLTLRRSGLEKIKLGMTSIEEVVKETVI